MNGRVLAGFAAVAALVAAVVLITSGSGGGAYTVKAEFRDVEGIRANYWVRVDGNRVGKVEDVVVTPRSTALVTMKLDKEIAPIGTGASAEIRPANLLGEKYIQLHRGNAARPLPSGSSIGADRTRVAVELDDILNMLAPDVRARLRIFVNEAGVALAGRGANFNRMFQELPPSLHDARLVVAELAAENRQLARLVDRADEAVRPVHRHREDVGRLVESASPLLEVTARNRAHLAATVRSAPAALGRITGTLNRIDGTVRRLAPSTALIRRSAPQLEATLRALPAFSRSLREPLATARRVAPSLTALGRRGNVPVRRITRTVYRLDGFVGRIRPLVYTLGRAGGLDGALGILDNWAKASSYQDGLSHFFDFHASFSERFLRSAVERFSILNPARKTKRAPKGRAPGAKLPLLDVRPPAAKPQVKVPKLSDVTKQLPAASKVTESVDRLLDYLLK